MFREQASSDLPGGDGNTSSGPEPGEAQREGGGNDRDKGAVGGNSAAQHSLQAEDTTF